jgi:hypothetical protein
LSKHVLRICARVFRAGYRLFRAAHGVFVAFRPLPCRFLKQDACPSGRKEIAPRRKLPDAAWGTPNATAPLSPSAGRGKPPPLFICNRGAGIGRV